MACLLWELCWPTRSEATYFDKNLLDRVGGLVEGVLAEDDENRSQKLALKKGPKRS